MEEIKRFKQSELLLKVKSAYDTSRLNLSEWEPFIDCLCSRRVYQKEAIKNSIIYLASGEYENLQKLGEENYDKNVHIREKYQSRENFLSILQLKDKLYADIDLATGTGKSYVMYGIARICLGIGLVERVLILCPSLTIESALMEKFTSLSADENLLRKVPTSAKVKNPSIISANQTIEKGQICIENIHAVYQTTGSSIRDSFLGTGGDTLILNDESHHIFNTPSGNSTDASSIKKWKSFLLNSEYGFKYMLGFTGTAYISDEYFPDVIYRYSLKEAIEQKIIKNVDYVKEDDSASTEEKFQKILNNHINNSNQFPNIKPISIIIAKDINGAKNIHKSFVDFLALQLNLSKDDAEKKVSIVTSAFEHKKNVNELKFVDDKNNSVEWIVSVSMLTEGWDVKNVFQIVPMEERAFNSKLLVSQVLGRGLRMPTEYSTPQPAVIVFNHKNWSGKIKRILEDVLEIESRLSSIIISEGERSQYNFTLKNINYKICLSETEKSADNAHLDFSRLQEEGIALETQALVEEKSTTYESLVGNNANERKYSIIKRSSSIDQVVEKLFEEFEIRDWEGRTLKLGETEYTKNNLPERQLIRNIIKKSMEKVGNQGEQVSEANINKILSAFTPLLRKKTKTVTTSINPESLFTIETKDIQKQSISISSLRNDKTFVCSNRWEEEITEKNQRDLIQAVMEDESFPRSAFVEPIDYKKFKTPVSLVFAASRPERLFIKQLCSQEVSSVIDSWIKSRDVGFYTIEYSFKKGNGKSGNRTHDEFNPDFFIKAQYQDKKYTLVVEIKDDDDITDENRAKNKFAKTHFEKLNKMLLADGTYEKYIFHMLSPNSFTAFFNQLKNGEIFSENSEFTSDLEIKLSE